MEADYPAFRMDIGVIRKDIAKTQTEAKVNPDGMADVSEIDIRDSRIVCFSWLICQSSLNLTIPLQHRLA